MRYNLALRWKPNASYLNHYVTFTDSDLNDSLTHSLETGICYVLSPRTSLNGNYGVNISDIRRGDTVVSHSVRGGVSHHLTPNVNAKVNGGVSFTEAVERVSFRTNPSISKSFDRGAMRLDYSQGIIPGGGLATAGVLAQWCPIHSLSL